MVFLFFIFVFVLGGPGLKLSGLKLSGAKLALVRIEGPIAPGIYYNFWMDSLTEIRKKDGVRGVVVRIDSPGGTVGASQELYDELLRLRNSGKTVYVSMGDVAASGGYYIASAADRVFANRGTLTGSVGVIFSNIRIEELASKAGIEYDVIKSGRFKDTGSLFREMSLEEREVFTMMIDNTYDQFVGDILAQRRPAIDSALTSFDAADLWAEYLFVRPLQPDARGFLEQIADGRIYTGEQALGLGLVDELGSLRKVAERLAQDLGIPEQTEMYEPELRLSFFDLLGARFGGALPGVTNRHSPMQYRMLP
jgi:protease-4